MELSITSRASWFRSGVNLFIALAFTDEELQIIQQKQLDGFVIVAREPTHREYLGEDGKKHQQRIDNNTYAVAFFGGETSWHADSLVEATDFEREVEEGFERLREELTPIRLLTSGLPTTAAPDPATDELVREIAAELKKKRKPQ